jgi:hypothetical protein
LSGTFCTSDRYVRFLLYQESARSDLIVAN